MNRTVATLKIVAVLPMAAFFFQQTSQAQVDPWERVRLVQPGKNLHVKLHSGKTVKGKLAAWNTEGISLIRGDNSTTVSRSDVAQVAMVIGMSRGMKAGWGLLIGGIAGAGIFGGSCAGAGGCDTHPAAMAAGGAIFLGGISAGIAALFPQHKEVIYTDKPAAEDPAKIPRGTQVR